MRGLREVDRILRGDATASPRLREQGLVLPLGPVIGANVLLAAFYGVCLGVFGVSNREEPDFRFLLADAIKVPLLFLLTLAITFPSLYVVNALVGSRLGLLQIGRLMAAAMAVLLSVLASFGPIVAFFSVTSTSYHFILLLTVAVFLTAGGFGINFLWRTLPKLTLPPPHPRPATLVHVENPEGGGPPVYTESPETADPSSAAPAWAVTRVFAFWIVAFGLVGMQMSWVLRPFIGAPGYEFAWFRPREGSFFEAVVHAIQRLVFGP